jgi:tRNA1(Val) A37 N6-methylase TrmN6
MSLFSKSETSRDYFLDRGLTIYQPIKGYRAATDPVFLAAACPAKKGQDILELGCGVGTASFCLYKRVKVNLTGIEIQEGYADLAIKNGRLNSIPIDVEVCDLVHMPKKIKNKTFDQIIINPPYYSEGTLSNDDGKNKSTRIDDPLSSWVDQGIRRLKPKGWITIINKAENLTETLISLNEKAGDIQIKPLTSSKCKTANRVIIRAKKNSKGITKIYSPLLVHTVQGGSKKFSDLAENILRKNYPIIF